MKLYLSSYELGHNPKQLVALLGDNKRVAVICNAADYLNAGERGERVKRELLAMRDLGLEPIEIDLRNFFSKPETLEGTLSEFGLLWIRGGNAFILRKAMALSGFDKTIKRLLDNGIVYAGYSAAACVAGPTLHGIELCDDANCTPEGYTQDIIWNGLGLIDYSIAPHYKSDHPESAMIDEVVNYFEKKSSPYKALSDGQVIIVDEQKAVI